MIGPYQIVKKIGQGAYAEVFLVVDQQKNAFAMKVLKNINQLSDSQLKHIKTEIKIMKTLVHPNIISSKYILASRRKLYIVMDYVGGGIQYCHNHSIVHRDIKAENILLDESHQQIFISDFGLSSIYSDNEEIIDTTNSSQKQNMLKTACGSPYYVDPAICLRQPYNGIKSDCWSSGILLYLMLIRRYPFDAQTHELLQEAIIRGQFTFPQSKIENGQCPASAVKLIKQMLQLQPDKRPNFDQILESDFVLEDKEYLDAWREICEKESRLGEQKASQNNNEDAENEKDDE